MLDSIPWSQLDPMAMVGGISGDVSDDVATGGLSSAQVSPQTHPLHPDHPFFWFAAFAAVTIGAVGASTHLRVGPFKAGLSAGKD
jgi:hypothetical protein